MMQIQTQRYHCGRYTFAASLPAVGFADDAVTWTAKVDGTKLPATFPTLEDAMAAAIEHADRSLTP